MNNLRTSHRHLACLLAMLWVLGATVRTQGPVFHTLGNGTSGTNGVPLLGGSGSLKPGSALHLRVASARPSTAGALILGPRQLHAPFLGHVLVPAPDLALPVGTDATGAVSLQAVWPGAPQATRFYAQAWVIDSVGPSGLASTNGLRMQVPPEFAGGPWPVDARGGRCQGSCRPHHDDHAASEAAVPWSGLRRTASTLDQSRVGPDQRSGLRSRATS